MRTLSGLRAIVFVCCAYALILSNLGCREAFGGGLIWASNESASPVLMRLRNYQNGVPVGPARVWNIDGQSIGRVITSYGGYLEVLQGNSCQVLAEEAVSDSVIHVAIDLGGRTQFIAGEGASGSDDPGLSHSYQELSDCLTT